MLRIRSLVRADFRHVAGVAAVSAGLVVLMTVLPLAPAAYNNSWGWAPEGARLYTLGVQAWTAPLSDEVFVRLFQSALVLCWLGWLVLILPVKSEACRSQRQMVWFGTVIVGAVALLFPPVLSRDVLGYVAYGRLLGLHGLNPYVNGAAALASAGDPSHAFLVWSTPLPYGPAWVASAAMFGWLSQSIGLSGEILAHKAAAGAALLAGSVAAGRIAAGPEARLDDSAMLAVVLNPLLIIEAAGSGHNDAAMTTLVLGAGLLSMRRNYVLAALLLGAAAAVKPVALAAAPLLILEGWFRQSERRMLRTVAMSAAVLVPTLLLSLAFGGPGLLCSAVLERAAATEGRPLWPLSAGTLVAYAAAIGVMRRGAFQAPAPSWLAGWVLVAIFIAVIVMPIGFPWYLTWALMPALAVRGSTRVPLVAMASTISALLMWRYALPLS